MAGRRDTGPGGERDERLSALLKEWRAAEPQAGFEAAVWRRIRSEPPSRPAGVWEGLWDGSLPHPIRAAAATILLALSLGAVAALAVPDRPKAGHALLQPGTVAGTYLALSKGLP